MKTAESGFGRLALLAFGIPLLILAVIGNHTLGRFEDSADRLRLETQERSLDSIVAATAENEYILACLRERARLIRQSGLENADLRNALQAASRRDGLGVSLFLYASNRLVFSAGSLQAGSLFERLMELLHRDGEAFLAGQRAVKDDLMAMFGPGNRLELIKRSRGLLSRFGRPGKSRGAYFWNEYPDGTSLFALVHRVPEAADRFRRVRQRAGMTWSGFALPGNDRWLPPPNTPDQDMKIAWEKCRSTGRLQVRHADLEWVFCQSQQELVWCVASPVPAGSSAPAIRNLVITASAVSALLLLTWLFASAGIRPGPDIIRLIEALPLRLRLTLLFVMATVLPLGLASIIGGIGVMDRIEVLTVESDRQALGRLHRYEHGVSSYLEKFRVIAERLRDHPAIREGRIESLGPMLSKLQEQDAFQDLEVRDHQAKPLFSTIDAQVKGSNQAIEMFSRTAVRRYAPARGLQADKVTASELIGEAILSSDDVGLASMLRSRGKVWTFRMGTNPTLWFWDVYPDQATGPAFICLTHQLEWIYGRYINALVAKRVSESAPRPVIMRYGSSIANDRPRPAISGADRLALRNAAIRSQESGRVLSRTIRLADGIYRAVIKPETALGSYILADLMPIEEQLRALAPIRNRLKLTAAMALVLSLLAASLIASLFIVPITDLGEGISAIRRRDSAFRIPLRRPDEFGAVASAFNRLLSEFKELEYGRIVQESLLPAVTDAPEGYEISVMRRSATDLAGDYYDVVRLYDGKFAIVLGDVTGHGIAAALPMAMAKATVEYETISRWGYPGPLLARLNALFNRELKPRQKFMTMGCILLDPVTHTITFDNSGHPYPMIYSHSDKRCSEMVLPSPPLGIRASRTSKPVSRVIQAGDVVLLYTDGIIECTGRSTGEMFGYPALMKLLETCAETPGLSSGQILERIFATLDEWRVDGPLSDDITLLLLRRNA